MRLGIVGLIVLVAGTLFLSMPATAVSMPQQQEPVNKDPWNAAFVPIISYAQTQPEDPPPHAVDDDATYAQEEEDVGVPGVADVDGGYESADP
jgi:hypothetical protein